MHERFRWAIEAMHPTFERLLAMPPVAGGPPEGKISGVYLFSEGDQHLYIGRSRDIRNRYQQHCTPTSSSRLSGFALALALEADDHFFEEYQSYRRNRELKLRLWNAENRLSLETHQGHEHGFRLTGRRVRTAGDLLMVERPEFASLFFEAKERIRRMEFRYVGVPDARRRNLLEIYAIIALDLPYNEFGEG